MSTEHLPPAKPAPRSKAQWAAFVFVVVLVGWFYVWTARTTRPNWHYGREQMDYYNLLIDGWLDGQLSMKREVPEELLRAADPYDPAQRRTAGMHDATYYKGKFYLYFGAAPAALTMLPYRLVTGTDMPLPAALLLFLYGGFLATAALWLLVRRWYLPGNGIVIEVVSLGVLGIAGLTPVLARRPDVWEMPIASGYCFAMLMLLSLLLAIRTRRFRWWLVASTFMGLAVAARPTYLVATPVLLVPLLMSATLRSHYTENKRRLFAVFASIALPLIVVGGLLAWHNYARFGDPLEFGQKYQLSSMYEAKAVHFSPKYAPFNGWLYFLSAARLNRYFPYIYHYDSPPAPPGYGGTEDVYGVFPNLPFSLLALFALVALSRRFAGPDRTFRPWVAAVAALAFAMSLFLTLFFGAHGRYMVDFTPSIMLLGTIGWLAIEHRLRNCNRAVRGLVTATCAGMGVFSICFGAAFSLIATHLLQEKQPGLYDDLARRSNAVVDFIERRIGCAYGPVELEFSLTTPVQPGRRVLVRTGDGDKQDVVYVELMADGRARFGGGHDQGGEQWGRPLRLEPGRAHRVRVSMGSLFPPPTHPLFATAAPGEIGLWKDRLSIEYDGELVLDLPQQFHVTSPRTLRTGPGVRIVARAAFTAADIHRVPRTCLRMRVELPAAGTCQPLLSVGDKNDGSVLYVRRIDDGRLKFGLRSGSHLADESEAIECHPAFAHELLIRAPCTERPGRIEIIYDGVVVWAPPFRSPAVSQWQFGRDVVGAPDCAPTYQAQIFSTEQFPENADPISTGKGPVRMVLKLPADALSGRDPLLVSGRSGNGDFVCVEYVAVGAIRFALDHWGAPIIQSEVIKLDPAVPHEIVISHVAYDNRPASRETSVVDRSELNIAVDGRLAWSPTVLMYRPSIDELFVGRNPLGGSTCGPRIRAGVLRVTRGPDDLVSKK